MLSALGPVNRSMGGASTAAPLEAIGALYWNPATISALPTSQLGFGFELMLADLQIDSSVAGLGAGTTSAEPGVTPVPEIGWVHHVEDSCLTYGLGLYAVAGFRTNYPSSLTNPALTPQSNAPGAPGGFGRISTHAQYLQMAPTLSIALTDQLSIGGGPTVTMADVTIDPFVFSAPDDADGSGAARYPSGNGTRNHWGGGAQLGVYYIPNADWHLGASIKSPQWMETMRYHSTDEVGRPRVVRTDIDLPMIISLGAAYSGLPETVFALDVRYFDYRNTDGLGDQGFNRDGSLRGLDWSSVVAVAAGVQHSLNDCLQVRMGYTFNQSPIRNSEASLNLGAPLFYQHELHTGGSVQLSDNVWLNAAYSYYFESDVTGPILTPLGAVPGSSVTSRASAHFASLGVSVLY